MSMMWIILAFVIDIQRREALHALGYARNPVKPGEFDVWTSEQAWEQA
jgi:hypothetical protein